MENKDVIPYQKDTEFYTHKTTGLFDAGVFYGYYYTRSNEIAVAKDDIYPSNLGTDVYEADGGTYLEGRTTARIGISPRKSRIIGTILSYISDNISRSRWETPSASYLYFSAVLNRV